MPERTRRLLALSTYPREDASVRQRFLSYVPDLERAGWIVRFESIISRELFVQKNRSGAGAAVKSAVRLAGGLARRLAVILAAYSYDAVWIHREAFPFFTPWAEHSLRRLVRGPIIFDFDDALYVRPPGGRDWRSALRSPDRFRDALVIADHVLSGSPALQDWARHQGIDAQLVPSCVDTSRLRPAAQIDHDIVTIGWIGSWSTASYLFSIATVLNRIAVREDVALRFIGADNLAEVQSVVPRVRWERWDLDREVNQLSEFDVGIMPVPDTPWNQGKCAYKLIQYMAMGIPFVASPVGMNVDVAQRSGGGILCDTPDEWEGALTELIERKELRLRMGASGRVHAVANYDHRLYAPIILETLNRLAS